MFYDLDVNIPRQAHEQALQTLQTLGYDVVAFTTTVSGERKLTADHLPPAVDYSAWKQPRTVSQCQSLVSHDCSLRQSAPLRLGRAFPPDALHTWRCLVDRKLTHGSFLFLCKNGLTESGSRVDTATSREIEETPRPDSAATNHNRH